MRVKHAQVLASVFIVGLIGSVTAIPASAQARPGGAGDAAATIQVLAGNLNTPRGVIYDADNHRILVAEAGNDAGNTGPCGIGEGGTELCFGNTGGVFSYSTTGDHAASRIISGLPSESLVPAGIAVLGLEALSLYHGRLSGVWGLLGTPATRAAMGPGATVLGQVGRISGFGSIEPYGDIASFETGLYGSGEESDPYDLITGPYGTVVANAGGHAVNGDIGGNDLELVNQRGQISQLAAFPQHIIDGQESESVPTTVAQGPDGAFYVGELTGNYVPGSARVWRVVPGQAPTVVASGFTNIIDIIFDRHGNMIVLEIAKNGLNDPDQTGALIKVSPDGEQTLLASTGMTNPGGVAQGPDGAFYVSNNTASTNGTGQLLKVDVPGE